MRLAALAGLWLAVVSPAAEPPKPAVDLQGDPLPDGAVARLGSIRFRSWAHVEQVIVSADGKRILSSGKMYELWDGDTGRSLPRCREVEDNKDGAWYAFSPVADNVLAIRSTTKKVVRVVDWSTGQLHLEVPAPPHDGLGAALSPDGKTLFGSRSYQYPDHVTTRLWKWEPDEKKWADAVEFPNGAREHSYRFSADARTVAIRRYDLGVEVWDLPTGRRLLELRPAGQKAVEAFALSADGKLLAREDRSANIVRVFEVATGKERPRLPDQPKQLGQALAFSPDGKTLAAIDAPIHIRLWDLTTNAKLRDVQGRDFQIRDVAFADGGKRLIAADGDGVSVFDPATGKPLVDYGGHTYAVWAAAWSPDGKRIVSGAAYTDTIGRVWDAATGKKVFDLRGHTSGLEATAYSPDGKLIATGSQDGTVKLWAADTGKELHTFAADDGMVYALAFSPDGRWLVSGGKRGLHVWDVAGRKEERALPNNGSLVLGLDFTPDGRSLLVRDRDNGLRLVHFADGKEAIKYALGDGSLNSAAFSPDGRHMVVGFEEGTVWVTDVATGKEVRHLVVVNVRFGQPAPSPRVMSVAYAPDGRTVATTFEDGSVVVFELATGNERFRSHPHRTAALKVAYAPDGVRLVSTGSDTTLVVRDLSGARGMRAPPPRDLEKAWSDLGDGAAVDGLAAIHFLVTHAAEALPLIRERLKPVPPVDPAKVARLIEQLDSPRFAEREKAAKALTELGDAAADALHTAARGKLSAEARERITPLLAALESPDLATDRLRALRGVEALERIGTPEARKVLGAFAAGATGARLTTEASAALKRLGATR